MIGINSLKENDINPNYQYPISSEYAQTLFSLGVGGDMLTSINIELIKKDDSIMTIFKCQQLDCTVGMLLTNLLLIEEQ